MKKQLSIILFLLISTLSGSILMAQEVPAEKPKASAGFVDLNIYSDNRGYSTLTVNTLASLPYQIEYFSLVDYTGTPASSRPDETENFYTEHNLRWPMTKGQVFSLSSQWVGQSGPDNDILRAGILIRFAEFNFLNGSLDGIGNYFSINLFPIQLDRLEGNSWQVEYFYRYQLLPTLLDDRIYLSGFADQNLNPQGKSTWVTEHQLGIRTIGNFYVVAEYRYNEFLPKDRTGTGLGFEYIINW